MLKNLNSNRKLFQNFMSNLWVIFFIKLSLIQRMNVCNYLKKDNLYKKQALESMGLFLMKNQINPKNKFKLYLKMLLLKLLSNVKEEGLEKIKLYKKKQKLKIKYKVIAMKNNQKKNQINLIKNWCLSLLKMSHKLQKFQEKKMNNYLM